MLATRNNSLLNQLLNIPEQEKLSYEHVQTYHDTKHLSGKKRNISKLNLIFQWQYPVTDVFESNTEPFKTRALNTGN